MDNIGRGIGLAGMWGAIACIGIFADSFACGIIAIIAVIPTIIFAANS